MHLESNRPNRVEFNEKIVEIKLSPEVEFWREKKRVKEREEDEDRRS